MERPYIICHMLTSLDGRIVGEFLDDDRSAVYIEEYENLHRQFGGQAWACGRVTMEEHFTLGNQPDFASDSILPIPRTDYVAKKDAKTFAVAVDPSGKLGWTKSSISDGSNNRSEDHIIEVLTEQVSDAYLAYLRDLGISYVFGGKQSLDLNRVVEKLKRLFPIDQLILEGGGVVNGSFLSEGLIDELSLIIVPIADGTSESASVFELDPALNQHPPSHFSLKSVETLKNNGLWIRYIKKQE
ncbi:hypothetical protein KAI36_02692 [Paenibacillus sp. S02]|nr:hypothetical protein KAI36_02692 [Paenibacillus sp. S02]